MGELRPSIRLRRFVAEALPGVSFSPRQWEVFEAIDNGATFVQMAWGRRSGKTRVSAAVSLWHCLPRPEFEAYLPRSEVRRVLVVATNLDQARGVIDAASALIKGSPMLESMIASRSEYQIRFKHGVVFESMPCNARGDRGRGASCITLDEFGHHFDTLDATSAASAAEQLFSAIVPAASQFKELRTVIVASTPAGDSNKFAQLRDEILEHPSPTRAYFTGCTWEISPLISEEDLEDERRLLGEELFRQEYCADFLSGGGQFLSADAIEACVEERGDLYPDSRLEYVVGIDPALSSDVFGCVALGCDRSTGRMHVAQVHGWEGRREGSFEGARIREDELLERVAAVCKAYDCRRVATDVFKAREIGERLRAHGILVTEVPFTGEWRRDVFAALRLAIDERKITLPNHPELLRELRALKVKYTSTGQKVELARVGRSHCDRAVALSLAIVAAREAVSFAPVVLRPRGEPFSSISIPRLRYSNSEFG